MNSRRSAATAGCWRWARIGAWRSGTWPAARSSRFLPIGDCLARAVRGIGRLDHQRVVGVRRWPVRLDPEREGIPHRPARQLPLPEGVGGSPRTGRAGSWPWPTSTMPSSRLRSGPSGWGRWMTAVLSPSARTGNGWRPAIHDRTGAQVWRIRDARSVADLRVDGVARVAFSPDGKWLMTSPSPCRLWAVGTWREPGKIGGHGCGFSPDGRSGGRAGREQGAPPGRDRVRPHARPAREPRLVRTRAG